MLAGSTASCFSYSTLLRDKTGVQDLSGHSAPRAVASPSDHLANERTFLAWVRTGIALIGFGLVIAKFAIFISMMNPSKQPTGSVRLGELLVLMGAVVIVYGLYDYLTVEKMLKSGNFRARTNSHLAFIAVVMALTIALALLVL